jgi:hypothetical protein
MNLTLGQEYVLGVIMSLHPGMYMHFCCRIGGHHCTLEPKQNIINQLSTGIWFLKFQSQFPPSRAVDTVLLAGILHISTILVVSVVVE